ncbi:hypothetical protein [Nonomuraea basaltis]|uniref:hypothetical protein n=1 Tax=Nonomuraea basaltis TaxID=2495887 RepID=UPI00110C6FAE|nr:hypothetical protein [Nonomuraea basaltis]TMS00507.1 hypothetical protein EJK15_02350 [Nonomuraea basaltis]
MSVETIYREFAAKTYGSRAARDVAAALSKSYEIVTSVLYSLGTNTANHSRLDYEPYCSSYHRSVSGKWIEPPVTYVRHGVNKRFHFWIDVVNHLSPAACKTDPTLAREAQYVLDRGWVTLGDQMTPRYLHYVLTEKDHGVRVAESALHDIARARPDLSPEHFQQLKAYFERTVLTARLHRAVAAAYFGYRIYVRDEGQRTRRMKQLIWDGLDDAQRIAEQIRTYPVPAASGEWDWVRDAAEAAKYHDRISKGWDRYGGIAVPRP